jgi:uncharacterized protein YlxW (UPF0749 family)
MRELVKFRLPARHHKRETHRRRAKNNKPRSTINSFSLSLTHGNVLDKALAAAPRLFSPENVVFMVSAQNTKSPHVRRTNTKKQQQNITSLSQKYQSLKKTGNFCLSL